MPDPASTSPFQRKNYEQTAPREFEHHSCYPLWSVPAIRLQQVARETWLYDISDFSMMPCSALPAIENSLTGQVDKDVAGLAFLKIKIWKPSEVKDYLIQFSDMGAIVTKAGRKAREVFGLNTQLSLEVYHDPEIDDRYLALYVRLATYPPDIMERIRSFREQFDSDLADKSGWLHVTTDFRAPG